MAPLKLVIAMSALRARFFDMVCSLKLWIYACESFMLHRLPVPCRKTSSPKRRAFLAERKSARTSRFDTGHDADTMRLRPLLKRVIRGLCDYVSNLLRLLKHSDMAGGKLNRDSAGS